MIRSWTRKDPILSRVRQFVQSGWPTTIPDKSLHPYWDKQHELSSQDGCLLWGNRVVVPKAGQAMMLQELHEAHPGSTRMKRIARTLVYMVVGNRQCDRTGG